MPEVEIAVGLGGEARVDSGFTGPAYGFARGPDSPFLRSAVGFDDLFDEVRAGDGITTGRLTIGGFPGVGHGKFLDPDNRPALSATMKRLCGLCAARLLRRTLFIRVLLRLERR